MIISSDTPVTRADSDFAVSDSFARTATVSRLISIYLSAAFCGLLLALPLVIRRRTETMFRDAGSASRTDWGFGLPMPETAPCLLLGIAIGLFGYRRLRSICRMSSLWITALCGGAVSIVLPAVTATSIGRLPLLILGGFFSAILWCAWLEGIRRTIPNHRRWDITLRAGMAFMSFGLVFAGLQILTSTMIISDVTTGFPAVSLVMALVPIPLIFRQFSGVRDSEATLTTVDLSEFRAASGNCCSPADGCDESLSHDHDHDRDEAQRDDHLCATDSDSVECCGGRRASPSQAPFLAGLLFSMSGFLLFFGPLMHLLVAGSGKAAILLIAGIGMPAGVGLYRKSSGLTGNAIALPLFLISLTLALLFHAISETIEAPGFVLYPLVLISVITISGSVDGLFAIVRETFSTADQMSSGAPGTVLVSEQILSFGALLSAGACLAESGLLRTGVSESVLFCVMIPTLCCLMSRTGLRLIPQPIVVTRFAERYLKPVTMESHSAEGSR